MEKRIKDMTVSEYNNAVNKLVHKPLSNYATFHLKLRGHDCYLGKSKLAKFEVWQLEYKNADMILSGLTSITVKKTNKPIKNIDLLIK